MIKTRMETTDLMFFFSVYIQKKKMTNSDQCFTTLLPSLTVSFHTFPIQICGNTLLKMKAVLGMCDISSKKFPTVRRCHPAIKTRLHLHYLEAKKELTNNDQCFFSLFSNSHCFASSMFLSSVHPFGVPEQYQTSEDVWQYKFERAISVR